MRWTLIFGTKTIHILALILGMEGSIGVVTVKAYLSHQFDFKSNEYIIRVNYWGRPTITSKIFAFYWGVIWNQIK